MSKCSDNTMQPSQMLSMGAFIKDPVTTLPRGTVYDITHSRKGKLTIMLLQDVDLQIDTFFDAEILEGRANYVSVGNNLEQQLNGMGTKGDTISCRTRFTTFDKHRPELETVNG